MNVSSKLVSCGRCVLLATALSLQAQTTQTDTQVTTVVQQIDAQGPVVVERVTTQFADVACTADNARKLFDALRNGTAVTLTSDINGETKTATFTPIGANLGYGETYLTLALAAEALRAAGVTGCATPEQWQAVLLGGPLTVADSSSTRTTSVATSSSSSNFPGILKLRSEGQGWGQIAQTTNVQLGQVVSSARSSFNMSGSETSPSPTGRSSAEMNQSRSTTSGSKPTSSSSTDDKDKDKDDDKDDDQTDASSANQSKSPSTDTLGTPRSNR